MLPPRRRSFVPAAAVAVLSAYRKQSMQPTLNLGQPFSVLEAFLSLPKSPAYFMSNLIANCAQPDTGGPFGEVSGR